MKVFGKVKLGRLSDGIFEKLPDCLTGKENAYKRELYLLYGDKNIEAEIQVMKKKVFKRYLAVFLSVAILLFAAGINMLMNSSESIYTDSQGRQYIKRPLQGSTAKQTALQLEAYDEAEEKEYKKTVTVSLSPYEEENENDDKNAEKVSEITSIETEVSMALKALDKNKQKTVVYLPLEIKGLKQIKWSEEKNNTLPMLFLLGIMTIGLIYADRFGELKRLKNKSLMSVERELPDFLNKIVLLMNSGLVLSAAFERILKDYKETNSKENYFYEQLAVIELKMRETNCPMISELKAFAERTGNRAFIRVVNVMNENIHKGTALAETLENESNFLWFQRKKKAEEQGKIAETKLTVPLAMELVALIMITLMPAMLEM